MKQIHYIYFSPAYSTKRVAKAIASGASAESVQHNITLGLEKSINLTKDDFAVICVPVYAGRVPAPTVQYLSKFTGDQTPVAIACVYGNRDYDDVLLELCDICTKQGFRVVGAAAFVARHSIFPKLAIGRPDENDLKAATEFGKKCFEEFAEIKSPILEIKGNRPYKEHKGVPIKPRGDRKCNDCGVCSKQCPTGAIDPAKPRKTDKKKCISCARCIAVCPTGSRHFGGILYAIAGRKFVKDNATPKENEIVYPQP